MEREWKETEHEELGVAEAMLLVAPETMTKAAKAAEVARVEETANARPAVADCAGY